MKNNKKEYWFCLIGPVKSDELKMGSDFSPRRAAEDKISDMIGRNVENNYSGWGVTEKQKEKILSILHEEN